MIKGLIELSKLWWIAYAYGDLSYDLRYKNCTLH